jgi:hypothetical protein
VASGRTTAAVTQPARLFLSRSAAAVVGLAFLLGGCGGESREQAKRLSHRTIAPLVRPPDSAAITAAEVRAAPRGSIRRAFLAHWRHLQRARWELAVERYVPLLQAFMGRTRLAQALETQAPFFRSDQPRFTVSGRTLRYIAERPGKRGVPGTIIFRKLAGRWRIVFDSVLDEAIPFHAASQRQSAINPRLAEPSPEALRIGARASRLHADYVAVLLKAEARRR